MAKINSTIFKQETIQSWFSGVGTSVNNEVVQPFQNAEQVIWKYNQAIQHNSLTQQGWERLLAQSDDSLKAYLTSIKGSTASMTGYNVALQGNITGFKKVSSAIAQYNALSASGAVEQNTFATAVSTTNSRLGTYLTGLNGANASLGGYIISLVGATVKTVALKVATIALNSAVTMGASLIISGIVSAISEWINKTENMIEASEEAVEKIKSINDELKNNQKTISDTAKRYAELAQGVDQLTGKNISLSSEDYEEFLGLSNQLAEMFPTLTRNYNDNGDAIVQLSGDVDTIVGSLQNLIEAQRDLANRQIVDELPTVFDGIAAKSDAYEQELSTLESKRDALVKSLGDVQSEEFSSNFMDGFANKWIEISGDNLEVISQMRDDYIKILEDANIDYEELTPTYEMKDGVEVPVGFTIKINSSDEEVEKVKNTIDGKIEDLAETYAKDIEKLNEEINTTNEKNKANWTSLSNSIYAWLSTDDSFKVMDDTMQATVQNIVNSLDWGSLNFSSWEEAKQYIQDNILSLFNTADGKEVLADIQVMFGIQTQFNNGDITVEQYQAKLQEFLASIESLPPESKKSIMLLFGIETNEDGTTTSSVDTMIANVEKKLKGTEFDSKIGELSLGDLKIASELDVPIDSIESLEELLALIQKVKDEASNPDEITVSEQLAKIEDLSNGLDQLDSIYADILDKEDFDFSSLLNNDDFANAFSQYTDQYENFIDTITKSPTDINACQEAFNELATAYINGSEALNSLTEATRDSAINELQQMGVSNAEEVVDAYLRIANAKRDALAAGVDMENITLAEINSLYNEGIIALTTAQYLAYYQFQKALSNENGINTQADCENLIALATNAGITGDVINSLNELMALHQEISLAAQYQDKDTVAVLTARADELLASIKSQASTMESAYNPVVKYTGGTNSLAAANKNLKNATDASNDALKAQKEQLEKNKEALEETKSEYEELYDAIQWFYDKQIDKIDDTIEKINKEIDLLEKQQENMDNILAAIESNYDYEISLIQDKIDALQDANDEEQRALELEEAKRKLQEAKSRKTLLVYTKNAGFTYQVDTKSIAEAESELEELQENEVVAELEKQIDALEEAKDKWSQIPDAYNKAMQEIAASNYFGTNWKEITLLPSDELLSSFEGKYTGIQSSIDSKNDEIDSLEQEKQRIEELKSLWEDAKNSYRDLQYEAQLSSFFGSDYEYQLLNNSATWRKKFATEYADVCRQIEEIENQIKLANESTTESVSKTADAVDKLNGSVSNLKPVTDYQWGEADTVALEYARERLEILNRLVEEGATGYEGARDKLSAFINEYQGLHDTGTVTQELRNHTAELNDEYSLLHGLVGTIGSGLADRLSEYDSSTSNIASNAEQTVSDLQTANQAIQEMKTSEETIETEADKAVSNVETTISNLLIKLGELKTNLSEIVASRTEVETITDEELLDTSTVVDGVHTKVGEIQSAMTLLLESITPLEGALDTLMEKLTTLDEVTLSGVIGAFGGASGGEGGESKESGSKSSSKGKKGSEGESVGGSGLLSAVKAVDEAIGSVDNEESLLGKLAQVDASTLKNIIAQFGLSGENGDSEGANLLNAVNAVSQAIVGGGKDDENSLIASIEQLGSDPTIEHVTTVSDSFQTLHDTINECVKKVEELSKAIESIPSSTATVGVNGGKSSGRAKGGIITKEDEGDLDFVAKSLGEDHMVALTEGEAVIPKETVAKNSEAIDSLLSGKKLDLKALVNRDIVLQRATPLDTYSMLEKYKDWVIPDSVIMSRLNLPSQDFSKLGVVNNNQKETVVQFNGDIHVHEVQNVDSLSKAIVQQLPRKMTQALSRRDL